MRLVLVFVALLMAGCDGESGDRWVDGYTWYRAETPIPDVRWTVQTYDEVQATCRNYDPKRIRVQGCAYRLRAAEVCIVFSYMPELEGRRHKVSGPFGKTTLFEHEVSDNPSGKGMDAATLGHCAGYSHRELHITSV